MTVEKLFQVWKEIPLVMSSGLTGSTSSLQTFLEVFSSSWGHSAWPNRQNTYVGDVRFCKPRVWWNWKVTFSISCCDNTVLMAGLGLGTKSTCRVRERIMFGHQMPVTVFTDAAGNVPRYTVAWCLQTAVTVLWTWHGTFGTNYTTHNSDISEINIFHYIKIQKSFQGFHRSLKF